MIKLIFLILLFGLAGAYFERQFHLTVYINSGMRRLIDYFNGEDDGGKQG